MKEYLQFQLLADMLRRELEVIEATGHQKPEFLAAQLSSLRIRAETIQALQI